MIRSFRDRGTEDVFDGADTYFPEEPVPGTCGRSAAGSSIRSIESETSPSSLFHRGITENLLRPMAISQYRLAFDCA